MTPLPTFLSLMKVPFVLRSVSVYRSPCLEMVQCLPLSRLSLMQMTHSGFLPMSTSDWVSEKVGSFWLFMSGVRVPHASAYSRETVSVFFSDIIYNYS